MSAPETLKHVTAEMRRQMPNACSDWADRIDAIGNNGFPSLRDWFAGQALPSVIEAMQCRAIGSHPDAGGGIRGFAATAYDIADAMLIARNLTGRSAG